MMIALRFVVLCGMRFFFVHKQVLSGGLLCRIVYIECGRTSGTLYTKIIHFGLYVLICDIFNRVIIILFYIVFVSRIVNFIPVR